MGLIHYLTTWVDAVRPSKANIRNSFRDYVVHCMTVAELQATQTYGARWVAVAGVLYEHDGTDATTPDNGLSVIVSDDGRRYKRRVAAEVATAQARADAAHALASAGGGGGDAGLTGARTWYVSTAGSDTNNGLTAAAPFLTIAKALSSAYATKPNGFAQFIQLADGVYTTGIAVNPMQDSGTLTIQGNAANLTAVQILSAGATAFVANSYANVTIKNLQIHGSTFCVQAQPYARLTVQGVTLGKVGANCVAPIYSTGANVSVSGPIALIGTASTVLTALGSTQVSIGGAVTLDPVYTFSTFASASLLSQITLQAGQTFVYAATNTGKKYDAASGAFISSGGGGAAKYPGTTAGTVASGGQYV